MTGKRNLKTWLTMCSFLLALVSTAAGTTRYVPSQYGTIQAAIDAAVSGVDQIEVAAGTYNEAINFNGKAIRLYSSGGAAATTINGAGNYHVVQCVSGEGPGTILEGFTITGGSANGAASPNNHGGGMYNSSARPTVKNCTFTGNSAASFGGGMYNDLSDATVTGCTFSQNQTTDSLLFPGQGAGMYNSSSSPTVSNCTFNENMAVGAFFAPGQGGGIYNYYSSPTLTNCTFTGNTAGYAGSTAFGGEGGGMYNLAGSPTVTDCNFSANVASGAPKPLEMSGCGTGMYNNSSSPTVTRCDFKDHVEGIAAMYNNTSSPTVDHCLFSGNSCGMENDFGGSPTVTYCTFSSNTNNGMINDLGASPTVNDCNFTDTGIGMSNNGGASPTVNDCNFTDNTLGGMSNDLGASPTVADCNFSGNKGGGMKNMLSGPQVTNCIFAGNLWGGMWNDGAWPTVTGCSFTSNTSDTYGGMYNALSFPTVTNCTFSGNSTKNGGGMYNSLSFPTVTNCTFTGNTATDNGGGMYNVASAGSVTDCTFSDNSATNGGGMFNSASLPSVTNCIFSGNTVSNWGGGMGNDASYPTVTNCTFTANQAAAGGGISNFLGWPGGPTVENCILWNNTPQQIYDWLSSPSVTYSDVQGGWGGTGNINVDPMFADADGRLSPYSPCMDKGDNSAISGVATDRDGNPRIVDGNLDGDPRVDMGAYEAGEMAQTIHVPGDCATIQSAIDAATSYYSQIEVAPGTYYEAINFKGKAIRLYSTGGPQVTTINGTGKGYHVVQCVTHERTSTILEGFTITGGNANGSPPHNRGGGMYNDGTGPTVTNCIFTGNTAAYGGGMSNDNFSWPLITGCIFKSNSASNAGGGMANSDNRSGIMTDCTFESNTASVSGGGMWNEYSTPRLTNCTFKSNRARDMFGGGMYNESSSIATMTNCSLRSNSAGQFGGGIANYNQSKAILTNCILIGNSVPSAGRGGGMYNSQSQATLTNCTFTGNLAPTGNAGGIGNVNSSVTLTNCILWGDSKPEINMSATVNYSDIENGWTGTGNKNANPLFADGAGRLSRGSPCIDAGNNAAVSGVATDLDGKPRKTDGDLNGSAVVDMGAYEYVSVDADADGIKDSVDTAPLVYSNDFADGSTTGTIIDRADQLLVIGNAPAPYGVWIEASASGGSAPAHVSVCGNADISFDAGDVAFVTCGSIEITAVHGTVEIVFTGTNGTQVETSLNAGNGIAFEPDTCTITAPATNVDNVVVIVDGVEIVLAPGQSKVLAQVDIDIYPNRTPNMVYLSKNYTISVVVFGSTSFNVASLNSSTVRFGRTGTEAAPVRAPTIRDMNADGFPDAMYGFLTFNCVFQLGDTEGVLTGKTTAGIDVIGRDSVLVSP